MNSPGRRSIPSESRKSAFEEFMTHEKRKESRMIDGTYFDLPYQSWSDLPAISAGQGSSLIEAK